MSKPDENNPCASGTGSAPARPPDCAAPPARCEADARVAAAEEIMRRGYDGALRPSAVARTLGLSLRRLQMTFREAGRPTPGETLLRIRLDAARRELRAARPEATVSAVALDCGFAHFGRFAAAYRARYGETPSQTLRGARRGAAGEAPGEAAGEAAGEEAGNGTGTGAKRGSDGRRDGGRDGGIGGAADGGIEGAIEGGGDGGGAAGDG